MWTDGGAKILANQFNLNITPSCVSFGDEGVVIGHSAMAKLITNPSNTIFETKRLIGQKYKAIETFLKMFPFDVKSDEFGYPKFVVQTGNKEKQFCAEEISALE